MERLYKPLALRGSPVMFVDPESAELAKYAANAFLALKISFINEIADLRESIGADVQEVASAIGKDRRIGDKFLHPGPGYGGSCFPKTLSALIRTAREAKSPVSIIEQVERVNHERKLAMACESKHVRRSVRDKTIAVLGLTFKPNTDDMRDAPSLVIVPMLQAWRPLSGLRPARPPSAEPLLPGVIWCESAQEPRRGRRACSRTEWNDSVRLIRGRQGRHEGQDDCRPPECFQFPGGTRTGPELSGYGPR